MFYRVFTKQVLRFRPKPIRLTYKRVKLGKLYMVKNNQDTFIPSEDTGTTSIHNSNTDKQHIQQFEWEGVGPSEVYSRGLRKTKQLKEISDTWDLFLKDQVGFGKVIQKLNNLKL